MALTNDFKIKNGLTVTDSISAGGNLSAVDGFFHDDLTYEGTLFNGIREEYTNSNIIRVNQFYTGAASGSYFEAGEYQKVVTIDPSGSSENYQVVGSYQVQNASAIQTVNFSATVRSNTLPNLTYEIFTEEKNNGTRYVKPVLWTKETSPASVIIAFEVLAGPIYGTVTADIDIIPRTAGLKSNVTMNNVQNSEQSSVESGYTQREATIRAGFDQGNYAIGGINPSYKLDVTGDINASTNILSGGTDLADIFATSAGNITGVTAGFGLTGGGTDGDVTLDAVGGDGIITSADAICVDSTVVRTTGNQTITGIKNFSDSICVGQTVRHTGDGDTCIFFGTNQIDQYAGGERIITAGAGGIVVNEDGNPNDFRVEGDTDTHALFVDGSADNVGIGTSTPGEKLEVVGNVEVTDGEFIGDLRGAIHFKAKAGENISEGEAVYISGISGNTTIVSLADADDASKMPAFGIATETASSGNPITVGNFGALAGLNTTQWGAEGDELFVGTTAGQLVSAAPTGESAAIQKIAKITRAHGSAGSITIMGAGRSNAVPNLDNGDIFIGNGSNQAVTASLAACVCATGDSRYIQGVTTGPYLTGGGSTGSVEVGIDSACACKWDNAATGGVQSLSAGDGLLDNGTSTDPNIAVDSTVVRTTGAQTIAGTKTFSDSTCFSSVVEVANYIRHIGDTDTCIAFGTDTMDFYTGGEPHIKLNNSGVVINEDGVANYFRVEGDTDANLFFVDGPDDRVGVGTSNPVAKLQVMSDTSSLSTVLRAGAAISNADYTVLRFANGTTGNYSDYGFSLDYKGACSGNDNKAVLYADNQTGAQVVGISILQDGTVGIGTEVPSNSYELDVSGSVNASGEILSGGTDISEIFTTCVGDVTGIDAGTAITITDGSTATPTVGVTSACNTAWNAKTTCTGTFNTATAGLSGSGANVGIDSGTLTPFDQSGCPGINCVGDVTGIDAGTAITITDGSTATPTVGVTSACNTAWNAKTTCTGTFNTATAGLSGSGANVGINSGTLTPFDQSGCPGINCTGTTTASNTQTFTNKSGSNSQWTNDAGYTTCVGDVTGIDAGTAITITDGSTATPTVGVTSACNTAWNNKTTCTGTVTSIATGSGLTGGTITTSGTLSVDSTVARTNVDETFSCDVTINGDLTVNGDIVCLETIVSTTSALSVVNHGSGPAITVNQAGSNDIVDFRDDNSSVFYIENGGFVGLNCTNPVQRLDVNGNINTSGDIRVDNNVVVNTGRCFTGVAVQPSTDIADAYIASAATWNAKTTCTGTFNTATAGLSGSGANVGINSGTLTPFDQSGCPGINCVGDVTGIDAGTAITITDGATATPTVSVTSACNTAWNAKTTCTGTFSSATAGLSGSGASVGIDSGTLTPFDQSGCPGINCVGDITGIDAGTAITITDGSTATPAVGVTSACNTAWNAKTTCTGTFNTATAGLSGSGANVGINSGTLTPFDQSGCPGINCTGDITAVTAGSGLTGGASSGAATLNVGAGTGICVTANAVCITTACNTAWNAKTTCTGTVTSVTGGAGLTGSVSTTGSLNVGAGTGICVLADSVCIATACNTAWNAKTTCTGTFNTATAGLSGSGANVGINSGTLTPFDQSGCPGINCTGTVTSVSGGTGLTGTVTSSGSLAIDTGVVMNLASNQTASGTKNFSGDICVGDQIFHSGDSDTYLRFGTNAFCIYTGNEQTLCSSTAGIVINEGGLSNDFRVESDTSTHMLFVDGSANAIGINCSTPGATLAVNGSFTATCKSFLIDNPVTGGQLKYGVLEGNEHGVTVRGTTSCGTITLPDEWDWLVHEDSVTAQLTPVGSAHTPYVICQNNKEVVVCAEGCYNYNIYGTRKDVEPLEVNIL